jgi:hypothetical protein
MISVNEISKIAEKRNKLRKETYIKIYEQISKKIRQSAEFGNKYLVVSIPSFVVGFPAFDRLKAVHYIKRQLDLGGFSTRLIGDHEIYICWYTPKKKTSTEKTQKEEILTEEFGDFPSFVNLKKVANKYRGNAGKG